MGAKWTVMIYFAGDNNLSEEMIYAIKEMYRVGVNRDVNVVVQFDPSALGTDVLRYEITRKEIVSSAKKERDIHDAVKEENTASLTRFEEIASSAKKKQAAQKLRADIKNSLGLKKIGASKGDITTEAN